MSERETENKILLSICIPTYNREGYLRECLDSIVCQFEDPRIYGKTEIIVSDNASPDDTEKAVREYMEKYGNIKYFRNEKNIGNDNLIIVANYATGAYLWVFADDDLHKKNSLECVIDSIEKNSPDVIFCNLDMFSKDRKIFGRNMLNINRDYLFRSKKIFFLFLNRKFYFAIDWYTTLISNIVLKKKFLDDNSFVLDKYHSPLNLYVCPFPLYYAENKPVIKLISAPLISYRQSDIGYGKKSRLEFEIMRDKLLTEHYRNIIRINKKILPVTFTVNVQIKKMMRLVKIILCWFKII